MKPHVEQLEDTRVVSVHMAEPATKRPEDQVIPLRLEVSLRLPPRDYARVSQVLETEEQFDADAKAIVSALLSVLPCGTTDRVLIELLKARASNYIVRAGEK